MEYSMEVQGNERGIAWNSMELWNIDINKFHNWGSVFHYLLHDFVSLYIRQSISSWNIEIFQFQSNFLVPLILVKWRYSILNGGLFYAEGLERYAASRVKRGVSDPALSTDELLGLQTGEHLEESSSITTAAGTTNAKLTETYEGVPVVGQSVVVETVNGEPTGEIISHLIEGICEDIPDVNPLVDEDDALEFATVSWGDELDEILDKTFEVSLEIYVEDEENSPDVISILAYHLSYMTIEDGSASRPTFIMDSNTGDVIRSWEGLTSRKSKSSWRHRALWVLCCWG